MNYNVPEGSYSTDPEHGEVRIREFKEMIQALHRNGFRVIMDVVYNHMYSLDNNLNRTVPWYYFRTDKTERFPMALPVETMWQASVLCVPDIFWIR